MTSLQDLQVSAFLSAGAKVGKLGYLAKDGRPLVVPIWFITQGESLVFHTAVESAKGKALRRDPRVSFTVDIETRPYSYVQVQGSVAEIDTDLERGTRVLRDIARRYLEPENVDAVVEQYSGPGTALFVIHPTKVIAVFGLGG